MLLQPFSHTLTTHLLWAPEAGPAVELTRVKWTRPKAAAELLDIGTPCVDIISICGPAPPSFASLSNHRLAQLLVERCNEAIARFKAHLHSSKSGGPHMGKGMSGLGLEWFQSLSSSFWSSMSTASSERADRWNSDWESILVDSSRPTHLWKLADSVMAMASWGRVRQRGRHRQRVQAVFQPPTIHT